MSCSASSTRRSPPSPIQPQATGNYHQRGPGRRLLVSLFSNGKSRAVFHFFPPPNCVGTVWSRLDCGVSLAQHSRQLQSDVFGGRPRSIWAFARVNRRPSSPRPTAVVDRLVLRSWLLAEYRVARTVMADNEKQEHQCLVSDVNVFLCVSWLIFFHIQQKEFEWVLNEEVHSILHQLNIILNVSNPNVFLAYANVIIFFL